MLDSDPVTLWINTLRGDNNEAAASNLWRHFMDRLCKSAQKKLRRDTRRVYDEEDAASSAFRSVCIGIKVGRFPDLNDRNSLLGLLLVVTSRKIARRHEYDFRQRRDVRRNLSDSVFIRSPNDSAADAEDHFRSREPTPEFAAEFADTCEALLQRLDDVKQQKILTLRLEGYTETEIADRLKVSSRTVHRKLEVIRRHCSHLEHL